MSDPTDEAPEAAAPRPRATMAIDESTPVAPRDDRPCPQGHACQGRYEVEEPMFTGVDYFWMLLGVSSRPVPFEVRCALCGHVWERTPPKRPH